MNYLNKPKNSKPWPQRILLVGTAGNSKETFYFYAGLYKPVGTSGWTTVDTYKGNGIKLLALLAACSQKHTTLVITEQAYEVLTLAEFWLAIEARELRLRGWDERDAGAPRCIVESPPTIVHYSDKSGRVCVICDSANFGWKPCTEFRKCTDPRDVSYVKEVHLHGYMNAHHSVIHFAGLGEKWCATAASQAWHGWRLSYMTDQIEIPDGSPDEMMLPKATYGGRCECFHLGKQEPRDGIWHLDANQLYSAAAECSAVPVKLIGKIPGKMIDSHNAYRCMASVKLRSPVAIYPYRPHDESEYGRDIVLYPTGEFDTVLCGPELHMAIGCGHVLTVHEAWEYDCQPILKDWARRLWSIRQRGGKYGHIAKSIAVGLYGKFAARHREWKLAPDWVIPPPGMTVGDWYAAGEGGSIQRFRLLAGRTMVEIVDGWEPMSSPHVNAWITSMGRVFLTSWMSAAFGHVYYCDTDSVWVDAIGLSELQRNRMLHDGLGGLRIVAHHDYVDWIGIRAYIADGELTAAGVPPGSVVNESKTHVEWIRTPAFGECMSNREWPEVRTVAGKNRLTRPYLHGRVQPDGRVIPFQIAAGQTIAELDRLRQQQ